MKKLFKLFQDKDKKIVAIEYSETDQKNYFEFVRTQHVRGMRQVIVTSELMLEILKVFFLEYNFKIININLAEEDEDLILEIGRILNTVGENRENFIKLLEKLECIANDSSIDIEKIELKSMQKIDNCYINFSIRVNGILSIEEENDHKLKKIIKIIKDKI